MEPKIDGPTTKGGKFHTLKKNETIDKKKNETINKEKLDTMDKKKNETTDRKKNETIDKGKNETTDKKKKRMRSKRGSGITRKILYNAARATKTEIKEKRPRNGLPKKINIVQSKKIEIDDDDPFVECDTQRWSIETALSNIGKIDPSQLIVKYEGKPSSFLKYSNTVILALFRVYDKLEMEIQNNLNHFYFSLENTNLPRYRNLTHMLHQKKIFEKYPWLTTYEKLRDVVNIKGGPHLKKKRSVEFSVRKPFSAACNQYLKEKCSKINKAQIEPAESLLNQKIFLYNADIPNTSHHHLNNNLSAAGTVEQIPVPQNDEHIMLSQEYHNMISAISGSYQYNPITKSDPQILENTPQSSTSSNIKPKKRSRWSSPSEEIPTLEPPKKTFKLTPLMHFINRKVKLCTELPLSLGDLIVLVSYYYKLEYVEQQLLIANMKVLEASKPIQAAYLRQYVRTTCPLYNEDEIQFKPLPQELILSELDLDLRNVTCIEDILEQDFCNFDDQLEKRIKIENTSPDCLNDVKPVSNEFDFGSAFL